MLGRIGSHCYRCTILGMVLRICRLAIRLASISLWPILGMSLWWDRVFCDDWRSVLRAFVWTVIEAAHVSSI